MITNFTIYSSPDIDLAPLLEPRERLPGVPCQLPVVDPAWLAPSPLLDAVLHPRDVQLRLTDHLEFGEPSTACGLAHSLNVSLACVEEAIAVCESGKSFRTVKRWRDFTRFGRGAEFVGTVGRLGFPEPGGPETADGQLPKIDPRTVLSMIRADRTVTVIALAKRLSVPLEVVTAAMADLVEQGHVQTRRRGKSIWAFAINWPDQLPKRFKAKAKAARLQRMPT